MSSEFLGITPLALTEYDQTTALLSKEIPRADIAVLPILYGTRNLGYRDYEALSSEFHFLNAPSYFSPSIIGADEIKDPGMELRDPYEEIAELLVSINSPLVVVLISTAKSAETDWFKQSEDFFRTIRKSRLKPSTGVYKIVFDSTWEFHDEGRVDPGGHFSRSSMHAYDLGAVHIPYNNDAPSVSSRRLVEFVNRLLGYDLPGTDFPDYSLEEMQKMAWNINREDFNLWSPREGAIEKYPIIDGRPLFPF